MQQAIEVSQPQIHEVDHTVLREKLNRLRDSGWTNFAAVGRVSGISRSQVSQYAKDNRGISVVASSLMWDYLEQVEADMENGIKAIEPAPQHEEKVEHLKPAEPPARMPVNPVGLYQSKEFRLAVGWCEHIRIERNIGAIFGHPGIGKTTVIRYYAANTPGVVMLDTWPKMRMIDFLDMLGNQLGVKLSGSAYNRERQIAHNLLNRDDVMIIVDEAEYLRTWDVDKFEAIRKLWDTTRTPVILCGTMELKEILRRGTGRDNLAQLYSRIDEIELKGITKGEVKDMLAEYNVDPDAVSLLVKIASDTIHGGMRNFSKILGMCIKSSGGGRITLQTVESAMQFKLMYS